VCTNNRLKEFPGSPAAHVRFLRGVIGSDYCPHMVPIVYELRTSALQSWMLVRVCAGPSFRSNRAQVRNIMFPKHGPFDIRAGYALILTLNNVCAREAIPQSRRRATPPELERVTKWGIILPIPS
jgi:hypothetical protein